MKFYKRDPDAAFAGMAGLTLEQIGLYTLILDLLYSRDGLVLDDDRELARTCHVDLRKWVRIKAELTAKGKIRTTTGGLLDANGVTSTIHRAEVQSKLQRSRAEVRWKNYRLTKENNGAAMRAGNPTYRHRQIVSKKLVGEERGKVEQLKDEPLEPSEPLEPFGEIH